MKPNATNPRFTELARAHVSDQRDIVFSRSQTGTVVMVQQVKVVEGKSTHNVFLKGAFEIPTIEAMYDLRDAINLAISEQESSEA